jgi:hypothetical protein
MSGNDKCVRDECRNCCYCGKTLITTAFYNGVKHVEPPLRPRCGESGGVHEPLVFPQPKEPEGVGFIVANMPPPVSAATINNIIAVRMCKLCGLVYWEPLPEKESP